MSGFSVLDRTFLSDPKDSRGTVILCKQNIQTYSPPESAGGKRMMGSGDSPVPPAGSKPRPSADLKYTPYPASGSPPIIGSGDRGMTKLTPPGDDPEGGEGAEVSNVAALMAQRAAAKSVSNDSMSYGEGEQKKRKKKKKQGRGVSPIVIPLPQIKIPDLSDLLPPLKESKKNKKKNDSDSGVIHVTKIVKVSGGGPSRERKKGSKQGRQCPHTDNKRTDKGFHFESTGSVVLVKGEKPKREGEFKIFGVPILVENKKGSTREGEDSSGRRWKTLMRDHYGEFTGVPGVDGDYLDLFVGPEARKIKQTNGEEGAFDKVWVIHIKNKDTSRYDEDKVMFGYKTRDDAVRAFRRHYDDPDKFMGPVNEYSLVEFKEKLDSLKGKKKGKRLGRGRFPKK